MKQEKKNLKKDEQSLSKQSLSELCVSIKQS